MRILLIYPYFIDNRINAEDINAIPMGLYFVAAMLRHHGYAVEILNGVNLGSAPHQIYQVLGDRQPDVVGFSILHANRWGGIDIARMVKKALPEATVVFGGVGATFLWKHLLRHFEEIDYVVRGEGEETFLELVRYLERNETPPPLDIGGLAFRMDGSPIKTADRKPLDDLDTLPMPAEHFTFQHVSLTRGCPSDCTFCGSPALWNRRVRFHSTDYFVNQLARLREKGVTFFFVSDDTFTLNRKRTIDVCRRIIDQGLDITWAAISRVDCVDEAMLVWMRKAGCTTISYGVESGSQKIRARYNKRISDEEICRAFKMTARTGIMARAYFIYGAPGESEQTINESLALIERIKPLAAIFYVLDLFPGTALYADYKATLNATDDIWLNRIEDILYFETDDAMDRQQIMAFGKRLREGYFARLPDYARSVELIDNPDLYPLHADFLSRLGLTFSHGDYAMNPLIPNPLETAVSLFERALEYHPDHRAFWGLGLVHQHQGELPESITVLETGLRHHASSVDLTMALANSLIRLNRVADARQRLTPFADHGQAVELIVRCCRLMADREGEQTWRKRLIDLHQSTQPSPSPP